MHWLTSIINLVIRDLRSVPRQPWFYPKRAMFGSLTGLILASSFLLINERVQVPGLVIFKYVVVGVAILAFLTSTASGANALLVERDSQTLDLLLISEFSPFQVVLAKQITGIVHALVTTAAALPMLAVCAALGGVNPRLAGACGVIIGAVLFVGHCLGLCIASQVASIRLARIYNAVVAACLFLILPAAVSIVTSVFELKTSALLILSSPLYALWGLFAEKPLQYIWLHAGLFVVIGIVMLIVAALRLPRSVIPPRPTRIQHLREELRNTRSMRALTVRPQIQGNPVAWMDLYLVFGGRRTNWLKLTFATALLTIIVLGFCSIADLPLHEAWQKVWLYLTILYAVTFVFGTISSLSSAFLRERRNGSLDMLLTSDLDDRDLLFGKVIGTLYGASPYAICLFGSFCLAFVLSDDLMLYAQLVLGTTMMASILYACGSAVLYLGMRLRAPAGIAAFGIAYVLIWAVICCAFPAWQRGIQAFFILGLITVIWHVYLGTLCWRMMLQQCRNLLLAAPVRDELHPVE